MSGALKQLGDLKKESGLKQLAEHLDETPFVAGYVAPNSTDLDVYKALGKIDISAFAGIKRWKKFIDAASSDEKKSWPASFIAIDNFDSHAEEAEEEEEEMDDDLFSEETEEEIARKAELKKKKDEERRLKEEAKKNEARAQKSSILLDVKPLSDEVLMEELETAVRGIKLPSLKWNAAELKDVAYGIKKLQILCTIEDEKVSSEDLEEAILGLTEMVQSMDIVSWNRCG
jgi:elongation factor 1-beta